MDKNIIKQLINKTFVTEAKEESNTPGITVTRGVNKKSGEVNKAAIKDAEKNVSDYDKDLKKSEEETVPVNKFNYNSDSEKEYHDQMEIMNGPEMNQYDREPSEDFKKRAKESLEGSSRMGNKGGKEMGNAEETWGASSDDFGKKLAKNAEASFDKRLDSDKGYLSFGDDIEIIEKGKSPMAKHFALGKIKESIKKLTFKVEFNGLENAIKMIPETYKVDNKEFEMTDNNETYRIRWEGNLTEGAAIVLMSSNKTMVNEDMQKMKHLMGYKPQETLGLLKGNSRLNESEAFNDIWNKTKTLLENEDEEDELIDSEDEKTEMVMDAPKQKEMSAPKPKTGNWDEINMPHAAEAKKDIEGSVTSEKEVTKVSEPKEETEETEETEDKDSKESEKEESEDSKEHMEHEAEESEAKESEEEKEEEEEEESKEVESDDEEEINESVTINGITFEPINEEALLEGFGDLFKSYDKIFMSNNKEMIDAVKALPQSEEKAEKAKEVLGKANQFIKEKGIETGSATSLKNEIKRAMGYNVKNNAKQS